MASPLLNAPRLPEFRVGDLVGRVGRVTRGLQFVDGLIPAQWEALRFLARANRYSRNPTALAKFLGTTKGTISQTLISLEKKGYLQRLRDQRDRRGLCLQLTPAGWRLLDRDPLLEIDKAMGGLPAYEKEVLVNGLNRILRDVQCRLGGNEFGVCGDCSLFSAEGASDGACRCGLTSEAVAIEETERLCVSFQAAVKPALSES